MIGQTVAHYRITAKLGSGGMGVVYDAEDTKLGRHVALKFLPPELATDTSMLERFQREARAASALNHPNICTVHAIDAHEGKHFIAMELLEGQTLSQRIQGGPFDLEPLLELGTQIADALESAHAKGIVHRDLKPANVFVTPRGQAKILDFGLAKIEATRAGGDETSEAPTAIPPRELTQAASTMGTVSYMSPGEHASGPELLADLDRGLGLPGACLGTTRPRPRPPSRGSGVREALPPQRRRDLDLSHSVTPSGEQVPPEAQRQDTGRHSARGCRDGARRTSPCRSQRDRIRGRDAYREWAPSCDSSRCSACFLVKYAFFRPSTAARSFSTLAWSVVCLAFME
jgi:serine/threonine protein kinase